MIKCSSCNEDTHPLALFPDNLCVACYARTPEANAPLTYQGLEQLTKIWGGK